MDSENRGALLNSEMPEVFNILDEDPQYNEILSQFARETNISYPSEYQRVFTVSRSLFDSQKGPFAEIAGRSRYNDPERWYSTINGEVQEKFTAVYYHYDNIKRLEKTTEKYCEEIIQRLKELNLDRPITLGFYFRKTVCEYEAFVFQLGACFEHFVNSRAYYFGFRTFKKEKFMNQMKVLAPKHRKACSLLSLFKEMPKLNVLFSRSKVSFRDFSERDRIAHGGQIALNPLNIIFNPIKDRITLMPTGKYDGSKAFSHHPVLSRDLGELMYSLFDFIGKAYDTVFE